MLQGIKLYQKLAPFNNEPSARRERGKACTILIDVRAEYNLKEGESCPKARKRKLWIINTT
jgi:hypothetical protein